MNRTGLIIIIRLVLFQMCKHLRRICNNKNSASFQLHSDTGK